MDYFTVEIAGRAVASFRSENSEDATHFFEAEDFRDDLTILESEGKPLWDRKAALSLRKATAEEASEVEHVDRPRRRRAFRGLLLTRWKNSHFFKRLN